MNPLLVPLVIACVLSVAFLVWGLVQRHEARGWTELHLEYLRRAALRSSPTDTAPKPSAATNNGASGDKVSVTGTDPKQPLKRYPL